MTNERRQELDDIEKCMKTRSGRRLLWRLLEMAGVYRSTFSQDALVMAFQEGQRNQGLMLLTDIHAVDPDGYILMAKEAKARQEAKEAERERNSNGSESE